MLALLPVIAIVAYAAGFTFLFVISNAIQEISAYLMLLIGTVALAGYVIAAQIEQLRTFLARELKKDRETTAD